MVIRSKKTALVAIQKFENLFKFDTLGQKHYVYFQDKLTGNTITVIKYPQGILTTNSRGKDWVENGETLITELECVELFYRNRLEINKIMAMRLGKGR